METPSHSPSHSWWKGALIGAAKGLAIGLLVGAASALLFNFVLLPNFAALQPVFQNFLTLEPVAAGGTITSFSMIPLALFSGVSGMFGGLLAGAKASPTPSQRTPHHTQSPQRNFTLPQLDGPTQQQEYTPTANYSANEILTKNESKPLSFAQTELDRRSESASTAPTI